ncbi:MAG: TolC family protein [Epsilonproteobacteria bacterium]|nr:TolC family protein [Campylobacterota bacterium]
MKPLYTLLLLSLSLHAQTLQEVIDYSLQNNYQLQILQKESEIIDRQADIESTWDDPILKAGINDVQFEKPLSRDIEAMQNQFVALSQTIPLSNRIEIASEIEREKQKVIEQKKDVLRTNIAFGVRKAFIEAKNAKDNLKILDEYISFLHTPMRLISNLSAVEKNSVERYIKTQLLQQSYKLQRESWLQRIEIAKERIELIGNLKVEHFSDEVPLKNYHLQSLTVLLSQLEAQSPELKRVVALKDVAGKAIALATAKEQADITVTGGYYQRDERNDYLSFSVAYPLYIHDKQSNRKVQAMKRANIQELSYARTKVQLEQGLKITLHELKALYQELRILEENRIKINQLIANAKAKLASGGSLVHYYELFTQRTNNRLALNRKQLAIALSENQIEQLLGVIP